MISIATDPGARYPSKEEAFSPSEPFPEYAFGEVSHSSNSVYSMFRRLLLQLDLDKGRAGTPQWNPLGEFVPRGSRVFVLCNFVYHRRRQESMEDFQAKCIHGSVLRALIDYLLIATGPEGRVRFGNSPLQSTEWERVLSDAEADAVVDFYRRHGSPVEARDLRLFRTEKDLLGRVRDVEHRDGSSGVEFDLASDSLLDEIAGSYKGETNFRISDYDPRRIERFHRGRAHRYVIHRDVLESDVVVSLSKLKTHEKVGITCGLKGFVGSVGHKDCLAHHRIGSPSAGGDEYPNSFAWMIRVSEFQDWLHQRSRGAPLQGLLEVVDRSFRRAATRFGWTFGGAWSGNDTCWRMAADLARILHFGDVSGEMRDEPQRRHLSLIDGIVAGERNGPLAPTPVRAGALIFGDDVAWVDRVAARAMGFAPEAIPLIRRTFSVNRYRVTKGSWEDVAECVMDGRRLPEVALRPIAGRPLRPSDGWCDVLGLPG